MMLEEYKQEAFKILDTMDLESFLHHYYERISDIILGIFIEYPDQAEEIFQYVSDEDFTNYLQEKYDLECKEEIIKTCWLRKSRES